ncbi:NupC/NupG family nucleoside CNT transporter [Tichowtungia aerotolerans]|uniref:Nucleoside permease n=1 Tax=Tichowtungia aerotolerans TaxID=2697043 RepID=A0A6P1M723_9BACT|nr:NupC/NupG family nucleoside CNT transporter [Tichowtungia aerotolerans]QHI69657.1 NupC/NupG family nucleoside CNT transporter [Tichowtungia aerotolerans]
MERLISAFGLICMVAIAFGLSTKRKSIKWTPILAGTLLQVLLGVIVLKTTLGRSFFEGAKNFVNQVTGYTQEGSAFLFGPLAIDTNLGYIFAIQVLPTIVFVGSVTGILYHLGIMQKIVQGCAWVMVRLLKTSGAESLSAAANIFVGQTEAPLIVKPYIKKMTDSELTALMSGGFATIAGGVLIAYAGMGIDAGHLLAASVMSAPAALVCAKLMVPETGDPETTGTVKAKFEKTTVNVIDAATTGAGDGLKLALNVGAMLLAFVALIAMLNGLIGWIGGLFGLQTLSFQQILGWLFSPLAWLLGIPWKDAIPAGTLLGEKTVLNEFVAYAHLHEQLETFSPRTTTILTYALCGFANFSSIAIQIGGIGTLAPERRHDLARLGIRALIAGTLACFMTACIAGMLL